MDIYIAKQMHRYRKQTSGHQWGDGIREGRWGMGLRDTNYHV